MSEGSITGTATASEASATAEPDNMYAAISLAAGLAGMFWVAIIFATIAHKRPGGRLQWLAGGVLGYTELAVLLLWLVYRCVDRTW